MLVVVAIFAGVFIIPVAPPKALAGRIVGFDLAEAQMGSYPVAHVDVDGGEVSVRLPRTNGCEVGSEIHLLRIRHMLGDSLKPDWPPCASTASLS